jgi:hypothetical protein
MIAVTMAMTDTGEAITTIDGMIDAPFRRQP